MLVSIEKQNDGTYIAYNKGCDEFTALGSGDTIAEAKDDFFNSIEEMKEVYQKHGDEVPASLMEKPTFKFDLASFFEYYSFINVTAFAKMVGINGSLMRQYKKGNTYISDTQLEKIQTFVNNMGMDFQGLRLVGQKKKVQTSSGTSSFIRQLTGSLGMVSGLFLFPEFFL